jgi:hypothetical protein
MVLFMKGMVFFMKNALRFIKGKADFITRTANFIEQSSHLTEDKSRNRKERAATCYVAEERKGGRISRVSPLRSLRFKFFVFPTVTASVSLLSL